MVLPLLVFTPAAAQDSPEEQQSEPAQSSVEPLADDQVIVTLPQGVVDPTNTQVGPEITASELYREAHFHTAEVEIGAQPGGVELSADEQQADKELNEQPLDYWVEGGPASVDVEGLLERAASLAGLASYMNIHIQAHPDDETSMWGYIDAYGDNSSYHKVFAVATRGEQSGYCNYDGSSLDDNEIAPNPPPGPTGQFSLECDRARMNSFIRFLSQAGSRYSYLDKYYGYYGEVSLSSTYPVDPCVRNFTSDGDDSGPDLGVDATLDSNRTEERFTCGSRAEADDVRIWTGSTGYTTVLFFNLGDGDLSIDEVEWAMRRIIDSAATLQLPSLTRRLVVAPFANTDY